MAENNLTIFQRLNNVFRGANRNSISPSIVNTNPTTMADRDRVIFSTNDKEAYNKKLASLKQQKYLAYQWKKASADNAMESLAGYTAVKLMYRDVDLMDSAEIGTALDIIAEEACPINSKGKMLNIYSKSKRTRAILEDLFVNRLHIYTELPMIARALCKYGNVFQLLNIDKDNGILGWMQVPVYEIDRDENGYSASYTTAFAANSKDFKPDDVKFVWRGHNGDNPFMNWQIAHFRLLNDSFFLPYGVSMLHKARRAWRMWSMMEDAMLIWRLDKAIERRIFKIYVGNIDDQDVEAYVNQIANNFKRTPIIDPATGQVDLRKNFLDISGDYFIPVRREDAPTPIDTLQAANSQTQMEDIEYMQNKMLTTMRVPKAFLNFQDANGAKAQNLSFVDVRFARMINRIQQFLLMELNKVAMIHLYILGLNDEMGNFSLTLNNPSTQIEAQELDDLTKRLNAMQVALADPGIGIPMMSFHKALRDIMKMSDSEIKDMLNEIRIEKAMAAELAATANIIKHTGVFDNADRIYGDYDAMNGGAQQAAQQEGDDALGGGGGMGGLGGGMGDIDGDGDIDVDLGGPGTEDEGDLGGNEGETDMGGAPEADNGSPLMEFIHGKRPINEVKKQKTKSFTEQYFDILMEGAKKEKDGIIDDAFDFDEKVATMDYKVKNIFNKFEDLIDEDSIEREEIIAETEDAMNALSGTSTDDTDISVDDEEME